MDQHLHRRGAAALVAALSLAPAACSRSAPAVGGVDADNVPLSSSDLFAHYQGVLTGATTVGDLLRNPLRFSGAPTPRALLQRIQAGNPAAAANAVPLSFLSYNVGLLDATLFGLVGYTHTPYLEERAAIMGATLFAQGYDVIALQEVWRPQDVTRLRAAATAAGYWLVTSPRNGYTDGLAIAVRTSVAAQPGEVRAQQYADVSSTEFYPANGFSRGFLSVRFVHATLGPIVVYTSHMAAFPGSWALRLAHARELGLHSRANVPAGELLFVLGDFNAAPYYRADQWPLPQGRVEPDWFANTLSYPVLMHYAGVTDLAVRGRSTSDADLDITLGDTVPSAPDAALRVPFGDANFCARTPATLFTATDCNSLYFTQYAGTEYPARIDFVLARDPGNRVHVDSARLAFTDPVAYGGQSGPLSDHYGQLVLTRVAPPAP